MNCPNCSADLPSHVRFCSTCGTPIDPEATRVSTPDAEATRIATRAPFAPQAIAPLPTEPQQLRLSRAADDEEIEHVIFKVRPTFLFVGIGYILAVISAILLTVALAYFNLLPATYSVLLALPLLLIPAYKHLRRNSISYMLTDSKIEIDRGLLSRRTRNIPLRNIQDVTVSATVPQRMFGFGDLLIDNASELGGTTIMHNIPKPRRHAEMLLRELRRWH